MEKDHTRRRRPKGTGTIVKMGEWYYGRITRGGKVKVIKLSQNQRKAEALWREWLEKNQTTPKYQSARTLISEAWPKLEAKYIARTIAPSVLTYYKRHYASFRDWTARNGKLYLEELAPIDIRHYIDEVTAGQSNVTKRNHLMMIRGLYEANTDMESPSKEVKLEKEDPPYRIPFTDDEVKKILDQSQKAEYGQEFHALIMIGLYTGLRLKDCVHLKVESISDGVIMTSPFKTKKKKIIVRIPLHTQLKSELESLHVKSGYYLPHIVEWYDKGLLFGRLQRIFRSIGEITTEMKGRKQKIPTKGFHALRATFITRLGEKNVSLPIVESLSGHLSARQTMHYFHPHDEVKKSAISTLPDFASGKDDGMKFIAPEMQAVIDQCETMMDRCTKQMEETLGQYLGRKMEVKLEGKWRDSESSSWSSLDTLFAGMYEELRKAEKQLLSKPGGKLLEMTAMRRKMKNLLEEWANSRPQNPE